jgi:O-antigen/teichoic acid export membrane protein
VRFTRDALGILILRGSYTALEFLCGIVIARTFQASGYGTYALVAAWVTLLGIPAAAGFDRLVLRQLAVYRTREEWNLVRGLLDHSRTVVITVSILVALVCAAFAGLVPDAASADHIRAFQLGLLALPFVAFGRLRQATLQAFGRITIAQVPETLVQPLVLIGLVGAAALFGGLTDNSLVVIAAYSTSVAVACVVGIVILRDSVPEAARSAVPEYRMGEWARSAGPFVWMMGMNVVVTTADTLIMGLLQGPTSAGVYRVASQAAMLVTFPLTCLNMAVAPSIAVAYERRDYAELQTLAATTARTTVLAAVVVCLGLIAAGPFLLSLFGPAFAGGYPALVILAVAGVLNASAGAAGYLLIMTRYERQVAVVFGFAAVLDVVASFILIPRAGFEGAAIATAISILFLSGAFALLAWRKLGIHATAFFAPRMARSADMNRSPQ